MSLSSARSIQSKTPILFLEDQFLYYPPFCSYAFQVVSFPQVGPACTSPVPCTCHMFCLSHSSLFGHPNNNSQQNYSLVCFNLYSCLAVWMTKDFGPICSSHSLNAICLLLRQFSEPCIGNIDSGTWFSLSTSIFFCQYCCSIALCSYRDRWAGPGNLQTKQYPNGCWEPWDGSVTLLV